MTRPIATTGAPSRPAYRGAGTQKINPRAEIVRLPSGSIAQIPRFEPRDFSQANLNKPLLFALLVNFAIWCLFALGVRALFFAAGV